MAVFGALALCFGTTISATEGKPNTSTPKYEESTSACATNIHQKLTESFGQVPEFSTMQEMTRWVSQHLPKDILVHLSAAGRDTARILDQGIKLGLIRGTFHNVQALSELMYWKSTSHLDHLSLCSISGASNGIVFGVFDDQVRKTLNLERMPISGELKKLSVDDSLYVGKIITYGTILHLAKIEWSDAQMVSLVKYSAPLP